MTHRSNQTVASQDQAASQPRSHRLLIGWTTALAALGVSSAVLAGAIWLMRLQIAEFFIGAALLEWGADADFEVVALDFSGAALADIRFGAAADPDASIDRVEARWDWEGLSPRLTQLTLVSPRLRLKLDASGRISAGALQRIGATPGRRRPVLPELDLRIDDGRLAVDAPFGVLDARLSGSGVLGRDFSAAGRLTPATLRSGGYALHEVAGEALITSDDGKLTLRATASAAALRWADTQMQAASLDFSAQAPLDLSGFTFDLGWQARELRLQTLVFAAPRARVGGDASTPADRLALAAWGVQGRVGVEQVRLGQATLTQPRLALHAAGEGGEGEGGWTLTGAGFAGAGIAARQPSAAGAFTLRADGAEGSARVQLRQARLSPRAARTMRAAFPDLRGAPVAAAFTQARDMLGAAGQSFELTAPLQWSAREGNFRLRLAGQAEARAANGVRLRAAALREDTPALLLQWPGPTLHGAAALELNGAGAPAVSVLIEALDWATGAPLEAEGALTLAEWRVRETALAAEEIRFALALPAAGEGRLELAGPVRLTGPLGGGFVHDLRAELGLAIAWADGWRVTASGNCQPVRFAQLETAGLSFTDGAFALCQRGGALLSAAADGRLGGGFSVNGLSLAGRLGADEPATLTIRAIAGRFEGASETMRLSLEAVAPRLAVAMAEDRVLTVDLQRVSAEAYFGRAWRLQGAFQQGALADPALPGVVSAIEGQWGAAPDADGVSVLAVNAGEALISAREPESAALVPLFNPLRLANVAASLRQGRIAAEGDLALQAGERQLARVSATHDLGQGQGSARVVAQNLLFDPSFQPDQITSRLRGIVANVRGGVDLDANVAWTRGRIGASGVLSLNGVSLTTATIPVVQDVRGAVFFDDLLALTTPPGQSVSIGLVDPGVAARDGRVQFQLLGQQHVAIERAEFAFAGGVLALAPTTITLGAEETRFELTLANVDAANLIQSLNLPDLAASGRVEGSFPLLLSRREALIENGVLRALPGGGTISYVGHAGDGATGPARVAFDALRSFRYDELEIRLDGDLGGEVISSINFSGENTGAPIDLGPIAPGLGNVQVRGVPFDFNVTVTAPFRRLAQTAASVTDPGVILDRGRAQDQNEPVDRTPVEPR
jgi:translocation and assembly module TamB